MQGEQVGHTRTPQIHDEDNIMKMMKRQNPIPSQRTPRTAIENKMPPKNQALNLKTSKKAKDRHIHVQNPIEKKKLEKETQITHKLLQQRPYARPHMLGLHSVKRREHKLRQKRVPLHALFDRRRRHGRRGGEGCGGGGAVWASSGFGRTEMGGGGGGEGGRGAAKEEREREGGASEGQGHNGYHAGHHKKARLGFHLYSLFFFPSLIFLVIIRFNIYINNSLLITLEILN